MCLKNKKWFLLASTLLFLTVGATAWWPKTADATTGNPYLISFEGKIVKSDGTNITDGTYNMEFKIYSGTSNTGVGDTLLFTEDWLVGGSAGGVHFTSGTYAVNIGAGADSVALSSLNFNQYPLWLSVQIGNTSSCTITTTFQSNCGGDGEMTPYLQFTSAPYALNAGQLGGLSASQYVQLSPSAQQTGNINVNGILQAASTSSSIFGNGTSGSVQIGGGTLSESASGFTSNVNLTVQGPTITIQNSTNPDLQINTGSSTAELSIATANGNYSNFAVTNDAVLRSDAGNLILTARNSTGNVYIGTGAADTAKVTVLSGGNVGIGTTSPSYTLDVNGTAQIQNTLTVTSTTANADIQLHSVSRPTIYETVTNIGLQVRSNGSGVLQLNSDNSATGDTSINGSDIYVQASASRVGIGTSSPGYKLDVQGGDVNTSGVYRIGGTQICSSSGCTAASGSGNYIQNGTSAQTANFNITGNGTIGGTLTVNSAGSVMGTNASCCYTVTPSLSLAEATSTNGRIASLQFHDAGYQEGYLQLARSSRTFVFGDDQGAGASIATALPSPGNVAATGSSTGGSLAAGTYYYAVTAIGPDGGETTYAVSNEKTVTTTGTTSSVTVTWNAVANATGYRVYRGVTSGGENVYYSTAGTSFTDTGAAGTSANIPTYTQTYTNRLAVSGNSYLVGGNLGVGTINPSSLFSVGSGSPFDVNNSGAVTSTSGTGQAFFTGHQVGSGYAFGSGIFQAVTDNPTGSANTYFQGVTNGTTNFSVRADGQGYFAGNVGIGTTSPQAALDINGGIAIRGYATTNTAATYSGQWTQLGTCTVTTQYDGCNALIDLSGGVANGDLAATGDVSARINFRVKQQTAFGSNPYVSIDMGDMTGDIAPSQFMALITQNTPSTIVQLWAQVPESYESYYFSPTVVETLSGSSLSFLSNQSFVSSLGAGTQVAANVIGNVAGSAAAPSITFTSNNTTGLFQPAANVLGVATNGVERLRVDSTGMVTVQSGGEDILLNGSTGNYITYANTGVAPPAFTTRSAGTKLVLYQSESASNVDYALGIDSSTLWNSVPQNNSSYQFAWYGGTTKVANLDGSGNLNVASTVSVGGASNPGGSGLRFTYAASSPSGGPSIQWSDGTYNNDLGLYVSSGLNFQGNSANQAFSVLTPTTNGALGTTVWNLNGASTSANSYFNGGSLGVGTTGPSYKLDVAGDINTSTQYRIGGTTVCTSSGCTIASGSGYYIQNGTSPQSASFNITGSGTVGGNLSLGGNLVVQNSNFSFTQGNEFSQAQDVGFIDYGDAIRYKTPTNVEYYNGGAWATYSGGQTWGNATDGRGDTEADIPNSVSQFRLTYNTNGCLNPFVRIEQDYIPTTFNMLVEYYSTSSSSWVTDGSATGLSGYQNIVNTSGDGCNGQYRFTFTVTNYNGGSQFRLINLELMDARPASQGGLQETILPFGWDYNRNLTDYGTLTVQGTGNSSFAGALGIKTTSGSALQVQNAGGTSLLTADTANQQVTVRSGSSDANLNAAAIDTAGGTNDFPSGWGAPANWTLSANSAVHVSGAAAALSSTWTPTIGVTYQVSYSYNNCSSTNTLAITMGGVTLQSGGDCVGSNTEVITAVSTAPLTFTPASTYTGTISNVQVKALTQTKSALTVQNGAGTTTLQVRSSGSTSNLFVGLAAGQNNTSSGTDNTALGSYTLQSNTTGYSNTATGNQVLQGNTTGYDNTASGDQAMWSNTTGYDNTATGFEALYSNTTGYQNTALGSYALIGNTTGYQNTALGYGALQNNTTGIFNAATGYRALYSNSTGSNNVATGYEALYANTSGGSNTATGFFSLEANTTGGSNTATGYDSLLQNTTGSFNTANGYYSLETNTSGSSNVALGQASLYNNTNGNDNTATGYRALFSNTTGSTDTALGYYAGATDTGNHFATGAALQNATALGAYAQVQASNSIVLGSIDTATNVGIGTTIPLNTFSVSPLDYNTGTACSTATSGGTTCTAGAFLFGTGTTWTSAMIGDQVIFADGQTATITAFTSATAVSLSASINEATGSFYRFHHFGLQVTSGGNVQIGSQLMFSGQTTAGDPTCTPGAIYYNASATDGEFRACRKDTTGTANWYNLIAGVDVQTFTASGTWTKPSGVTVSYVMMCGGGGGGGGGAFVSGTSNGNGGGGGGGGAFVDKFLASSDLTSTVAVTIGGGGSGGARGTGGVAGATGGNGGTTTFGSYLSAYGGSGGAGGNATPNGGAGGGLTSVDFVSSGSGAGWQGGASNSGSAEKGGSGGGTGTTGSVGGGGGYSAAGGGGGGGGGGYLNGNQTGWRGGGGGASGNTGYSSGGNATNGTSGQGSNGSGGTAANTIHCGSGGGGGGGAYNSGGFGGIGGSGGGGGGGGGGDGPGTGTSGSGGSGGAGEIWVFSW